MTRKRPLTPEEDRLWRQVMKDTEPLNTMSNPGAHTEHPRPVSAKPAPTHHGHPPPPNRPPKKVSRTMPPIIRHAADRAPTPPRSSASSAADLSDIDRKSQERIRRGKIEVDAKIDLHGMRQSEAHQALIARISRARLDGKRVLLVVTGKGASKDASGGGPSDGSDPFWARGGGVLKAQVPKWLREDPLRSMIFSVQQAHQRHGGAGALYVFLKRVR